MAASNNRVHASPSLYYCLFALRIYIVVLHVHPVRGESHIQRNATREVATQVIQQNENFSSGPHQNSRNFIRGKTSGFWAQQSWNFWNRICISKIMSIWNFDVFHDDWTKKFLEFCCWNFNWLSLLYLGIFSFNILQWSGRFHAKQNNTGSFSLVTFEPTLIVVIRQHVFHVRSSMMIL